MDKAVLTQAQLDDLYEAIAGSLNYDTEAETLDNEFNLHDGTAVYVCGRVYFYWQTYNNYHPDVHDYEQLSELAGANIADLEIGVLDGEDEYPVEVTADMEADLETYIIG